MIAGIGTDLCRIERMAELLKDSAFLKRYFDEREQAYILARGVFAPSSMAGIFAAKEAFVKAIGSGFNGINPKDVVILHKDNGAPMYELLHSAMDAAQARSISAIHLSISHEGGIALAFTVLERE